MATADEKFARMRPATRAAAESARQAMNTGTQRHVALASAGISDATLACYMAGMRRASTGGSTPPDSPPPVCTSGDDSPSRVAGMKWLLKEVADARIAAAKSLLEHFGYVVIAPQ